MSELFKRKPLELKRTVRREVRLTVQEDEAIQESAKNRQLDFSEFMRRAALGRRADVNFDVELVLTMRELSRTINSIGKLHEAMIEREITPPVDDWREVKMSIRLAMERVAQKAPFDF